MHAMLRRIGKQLVRDSRVDTACYIYSGGILGVAAAGVVYGIVKVFSSVLMRIDVYD